ncbi:MAG: cupin domain-containing protein [Bdellovibrio sp.]
MLIHRWQAPIHPDKAFFRKSLAAEGLEPFDENLPSGYKIPDHRHPFGEIRFVVEGELLFNVSGNQVLLRPGDRIEIPANTRHSHSTQGSQTCICVCAHRVA